MAALPKKRRSKGKKTTLKQRVVATIVVLVPALIVVGWLIMTVLHNQPSK